MSPGIPSRIGEAKRDLGAMATALGVVGGGGSPNEMRSDGGILIAMGVEETLKRHIDLITVETVTLTAAPAIGAEASASFSFPEDHYILGMTAYGITTPANMEWYYLRRNRQPSANSMFLIFGETADQIILAAGTILVSGNQANAVATPPVEAALPLFGLAETDYSFVVRATAAGGCLYRLVVTVARAPKGVEIAH